LEKRKFGLWIKLFLLHIPKQNEKDKKIALERSYRYWWMKGIQVKSIITLGLIGFVMLAKTKVNIEQLLYLLDIGDTRNIFLLYVTLSLQEIRYYFCQLPIHLAIGILVLARVYFEF